MFYSKKLIPGCPTLILLFIIGVVASAPSPSQRESKKALSTIGRFLRSKPGAEWLAGLSQTKSGPLTTAELMDHLLKSTKPNGRVFKAAKILRKALAKQKLKKGDPDAPDAWDDLVKNIEDQDDIICLYRKDSDSSMRKADDWKKFLRSVSSGYTVHLALDKGQKYVICLKKISVPDSQNGNDTSSLEMTTKSPSETTMKETTNEPDKGTTTETILETTAANESSVSEEDFEPKVTETRKSRFGPSVYDIQQAGAGNKDNSEFGSDCSGEDDSDEDDVEDSGRRQVEGEDESTNLDAGSTSKPCSRQIIVMMPNPYGTPGSPNNWVYYPLQSSEYNNQLPQMADQVRNFNYPLKQPDLNNWNRWNWKYPIATQNSKGFNLKHWHHEKGLRGFKNHKGNHNPGFYQTRWPNYQPVQNSHQAFYKHARPSDYSSKSMNNNGKPFGKDFKPSSQDSYEAKKKRRDQLQNFELPSGINSNQIPNFGSRPGISRSALSPYKSNYPEDYSNRYDSNSPNQINCFNNKNSLSNPQGRKCQPNKSGKLPMLANRVNQGFRRGEGYVPWELKKPVLWNSNPYGLLQRNSQNLPNNQKIFPGILKMDPKNQKIFPYNQRMLENQQMIPNYQQIIPNNQQRLPNNLPIFPGYPQMFPNNQLNSPDNQQKYPNNSPMLPNLGSSLANAGLGKCPSLCDKPIELRISIEGNVDRPVKVGVLSQPGTWVNIVDNKGNSRRMLNPNEVSIEDVSEEKENSEEEGDNKENNEKEKEIPENFDDELIQKQVEKNEEISESKVVAAKPKEEIKGDNEKEEKEENKKEKEKEVETRLLPETITTTPDIISSDNTTQVSAPAI